MGVVVWCARNTCGASMKALPKRKGNLSLPRRLDPSARCLNESPSEKEGKSRRWSRLRQPHEASMKALPKRKGNNTRNVPADGVTTPQ